MKWITSLAILARSMDMGTTIHSSTPRCTHKCAPMRRRPMPRTILGRLLLLCWASGLTTSACAPLRAQAQAPILATTTDSILFTLTLRAVASDPLITRPIRIDPHPMISNDTVSSGSAAFRAVVPAGVVSARRAEVVRMELETTDSAVEPSHCPRMRSIHEEDIPRRTNCPSSASQLIAFGLSRPMSGTGSAAASQPQEGDMRAIRMILVNIGPHGFARFGSDYLYAFHRGDWTFQRWVLVFRVE